jgi:hypothetical protein
MEPDTFTGVEVVVTGKRCVATADASQMANFRPNASRRGNTAPTSEDRAAGLSVLQDWILSAREAGLIVEVYDMRPDEDAVGVVIRGTCYHADCGKFSVGNICGKCQKDVVTDCVVSA